MKTDELYQYIDDALIVIKKTLYELRAELLVHYGTIDHDKKDDKTAVTWLDKHVEQVVKDALKTVDIQPGYFGEEFGQEGSKDLFWTIDPIDGTEAYIRGMPFCTNMLGLISGDEPVAVVIYNFVLDEMFIAVKGKGAFCNDKPLQVSNRTTDHSVLLFDINRANERNLEIYSLMPRYSDVKFLSSGYGFCQVAKGAIEAKVHYKPYGKVWDYAPGSLLVSEAGGKVANIGSTTYDYKNFDFIASNIAVFDDLQRNITKIVSKYE